MSAWTKDDLDKIGESDELELAATRRTGPCATR
jgi:hypothetical protein